VNCMDLAQIVTALSFHVPNAAERMLVLSCKGLT